MTSRSRTTWSGRCGSWLPSGSAASPTAGPTSTPWARRSTRCWRCGPRSPSATRSSSSTRSPTRPRCPCGSTTAGSPATWKPSSLKALAKDPKDRFATAGELRDELRRFLENRPIRSRPVGPAEQFWRWCKRNPALAAANITAAVLTTLLAIGSTIAAWTYRDQLHKLDIEQEKTSELESGPEGRTDGDRRLGETQKAEHKARLALGQSLVSEGAALQRTGLIGQRFESLDRLGRAAQVLGADPEGRKRLPEIRNHAIAALGLTDLRVRWQHDYGDVFGISVDAALERYAVVEKSGAGGRAPAGRRREAGPPAGARPAEFLVCLA